MNKIKESFQHHEEIGRRYKNLSYNDTRDINEAFTESDEEVKQLREALEEIRDYGRVETHEDAFNMMDTAREALKETE